jgi:hypothetical protein
MYYNTYFNERQNLMDGEARIFSIGLLVGLVYLICQFYWLRVASCGLLLLAWGAGSFFGPLYLAWDDFQHGNGFGGIFTLAISAVMYIPWFMGLKAAREWVRREIEFGRWTKLSWDNR